MNPLFWATVVVLIAAGLAPRRYDRWLGYLAGVILGVDAGVLLVTGRIAPGVVCLALSTLWLTLAINRRPGGAR